jgi:hypothetical protein
MAGIFSAYRSEHHPDADARLPLAKALLNGEIDGPTAERILRRRDRRLRLELESSSLAGILIEPLSRACPRKKFILTIRDVYSWCDSWLDHNVNDPPDTSSPWGALDVVRLRVEEEEPTSFDAPLLARGFPPLACFFRLWADHNAGVLAALGPSRLLVVRTQEITAKIPEIAAWAGVPAENLRPEQSWLAASPQKHHLLATLDESYVRETAERFCAGLMSTYFPEASWAKSPTRTGIEPQP